MTANANTSKSIITWAPGLTGTVAPVYANWDDIESVVNALQGNVKLCVDMTGLSGFAQVPATANLDGKGRLEIVGAGPNGEAELQIADGGQIRNVQSWRTVVVRATPMTKSPIKYDAESDGIVIDCFDATFMYAAAATMPVMSIESPNYIAILFVNSALYNNHNVGKPVMNITGNIPVLLLWTMNGFLPSPTAFNDTIAGPAGAQLNLQVDASIPPLSLSGFLGTTTTTVMDQAGGVQYTAGTPTNWAGSAPTTVQQALDRMASLLKTLNGGNPIP